MQAAILLDVQIAVLQEALFTILLHVKIHQSCILLYLSLMHLDMQKCCQDGLLCLPS